MSTRETYSKGLGAAVVIAALGVAGASAPALGVPVVFENPAGPGYYQWARGMTPAHDYLDITLPASSQGVVGAAPGRFSLGAPTNISIVGNGSGGTSLVRTLAPSGGFNVIAAFAQADLIGLTLSNPSHNWFVSANMLSSGGNYFPDGTPLYIGARFNPGDGLHYGWIGVVRTGAVLDAFAWGYETEVGVPIAAGAGLVPAPGCGALVMGAAVLAGRRRRRD